MSKIGRSVLNNPPKDVLTRPWLNNTLTSRDKVLRVLEAKRGWVSISEIARNADLSWITTRNALNELLLLGKVEGVRQKKGRGRPLLFKLKS